MNQCNFIGRITKDLELKMAGQHQVVNFSLAVNDPKTKDGKERTAFVDCAAFNKSAELITRYCAKGDLIRVTAKFQTKEYEHNGKKGWNKNFVISEFEFMPNPKREINGNVAPKTDSNFANDDIPF